MKNIILKLLYFSIFIAMVFVLSTLASIYNEHIPDGYYSEGIPNIIGLLDSELFMGLLFMVTLSIVGIFIKILWDIHEIPVHKSQHDKHIMASVIFALSLSGLLIDKAWWVLAIFIAFTPWDLIGKYLSQIIHEGTHTTGENADQSDKQAAAEVEPS